MICKKSTSIEKLRDIDELLQMQCEEARNSPSAQTQRPSPIVRDLLDGRRQVCARVHDVSLAGSCAQRVRQTSSTNRLSIADG